MKKIFMMTSWVVLCAVGAFFILQAALAADKKPLQVPDQGLEALTTGGPKPVMIPLSDLRVVHKIPSPTPLYETPVRTIKPPPPESAWINRDKIFYSNLLGQSGFDVLVVPFQASHYAVGQNDRLLMTSRLIKEIEAATNLSVAPWWPVHRALGGNAYGYNDMAVRGLARKLGVRFIIWGYAGYMPAWWNEKDETQPLKRQYHFDFILEKMDPASPSADTGHDGKKEPSSKETSLIASWKGVIHQTAEFIKDRFKQTRADIAPGVSGFPHKRWSIKPASRTHLPSQVFSENISEIMTFLDLPGARKNPPLPKISKILLPELTDNRMDFLDESDTDPVSRAHRLQFLAMLSSPRAEYLHDLLFIRSLDPISRLDMHHPRVRLLYARAYLHLNMRPAALALLRQPANPAEKAFVDYLNGNLTEFSKSVEKIETPLLKFMAQVELSDMRLKYYGSEKDKDAPYPDMTGWAYFIYMRQKEHDWWHRRSNLNLKTLMDMDVPIKDFTAGSAMQGAALAEKQPGGNG